jgi:hypothetical protein
MVSARPLSDFLPTRSDDLDGFWVRQTKQAFAHVKSTEDLCSPFMNIMTPPQYTNMGTIMGWYGAVKNLLNAVRARFNFEQVIDSGPELTEDEKQQIMRC